MVIVYFDDVTGRFVRMESDSVAWRRNKKYRSVKMYIDDYERFIQNVPRTKRTIENAKYFGGKQ